MIADKEYYRQYHIKNKEHIQKRHRQWWLWKRENIGEDERDKKKQYMAEYYKQDAERFKKKQKVRYLKKRIKARKNILSIE